MIDTSALSGRRVWVTGQTGFKGSWLCLALEALGAQVSGFSLPPPTEPNHFTLARVGATLAHDVRGDVRDLDAVCRALEAANPEVVFHLAAQPLVRESYEHPVDTFNTNVMGTVNVLEAVRRRAAPCVVVVVTSDKAYENVGKREGYDESDALGGHDPYSASKGAAEIVTSSYRRSYFSGAGSHIRVASARAGNVIGGGDWARDRVVVDAIEALRRCEPVRVRNPHAVRPWQHVLEPIQGYLALAARLVGPEGARFAKSWNFGPAEGEERTVGELVSRLCEAWGDGRWVDASDPSAPHEAAHLSLSIARAKRELGWSPRWCVEEAIARTAAWYRRWSEAPHASMREASLADCRAYALAAP